MKPFHEAEYAEQRRLAYESCADCQRMTPTPKQCSRTRMMSFTEHCKRRSQPTSRYRGCQCHSMTNQVATYCSMRRRLLMATVDVQKIAQDAGISVGELKWRILRNVVMNDHATTAQLQAMDACDHVLARNKVDLEGVTA